MPPQITCASAPPDEMGKHENYIFTQLDCVAHPLTARFVAVLKHFYFLSFIPSDIVFYSLHFSLAIFIVRRP